RSHFPKCHFLRRSVSRPVFYAIDWRCCSRRRFGRRDVNMLLGENDGFASFLRATGNGEQKSNNQLQRDKPAANHHGAFIRARVRSSSSIPPRWRRLYNRRATIISTTTNGIHDSP